MNKPHFYAAIFFALVVASCWHSCAKAPNYPDEPIIEFKSLSKSLLRQSSLPGKPDSVLITFTFTDGDGDIGSQSQGDKNLFYIDGRDSFPKDTFTIPYVDLQGAGNGISGEISFIARAPCCLFTDTLGFKYACQEVPIQFDTLTYIIWIRDRAGHVSNQIETPPISLICKQ